MFTADHNGDQGLVRVVGPEGFEPTAYRSLGREGSDMVSLTGWACISYFLKSRDRREYAGLSFA